MRKNIIIMYTISLLQGMVFYASISTLYRQANGITLLQMGIIESIFSFLTIVLEVPWGILCDQVGYKKTLITCNGIYLLSKIVFYQAHSFFSFLLERVLLAIVISGLSGCDTALLYESIDERESTKVFGIYNSCGTLGLLLASLIFSLCIKDDISKTALWTIPPYVIAFFLTFLLRDVKKQERERSISIKDITSICREKKSLLLFILAVSLFNETVHTLGTFYNQLQYDRVGISMEWFGIIYTLITICTLSSAMVGKIVRYINEEKLISVLYIVALIPCILLYFTTSPILSILCIAVLQVSEAFFYPLTNTILNDSITSNRATILSCYSLLMNCNGMLTNVVFGKTADINLLVAIAMGIVFLLVGFMLYQKWQSINKEM